MDLEEYIEEEMEETEQASRKLPKLRKVRLNERIARRALTPEALTIHAKSEDFVAPEPDEDDYSTPSDITDPFEGLHHHCFLKKLPGRKRRYTKREADFQLMESFTKDFKTAMETVKKETGVSKCLTLNDIKKEVEQALASPREGQPMPSELEEKFKAMPVIKSKKDELEESSDSEKSSTIFDGMSPVWKMLASGHQKFFATPPGYNAFRPDEPHWLERGIIPWEHLNDAKLKCEEWLKKHSQEQLLPPARRTCSEKRNKIRSKK